MNAFTEVRPRGPDLDIPAKPARKKAGHGVPMTVMPDRKALDSKGRPTVGIAPRVMGAILPAGMRGKDFLPGCEWSHLHENQFAGTSVDVVLLRVQKEAA